MKKLFKPACLLMNLLALCTFFFIGIAYAGLINAGKGQMLAGGAIVLGYGVIFSIVAFITSLFLTHRLKHKVIVKTNVVLFLALIVFLTYFRYQYQERQELKQQENQTILKPTQGIRISYAR